MREPTVKSSQALTVRIKRSRLLPASLFSPSSAGFTARLIRS